MCSVHLRVTATSFIKKSCYEKWHSVKDLSGLKNNNSVKATRTSPRKKQKQPTPILTGSTANADGVRRSTHRKNTPMDANVD